VHFLELVSFIVSSRCPNTRSSSSCKLSFTSSLLSSHGACTFRTHSRSALHPRNSLATVFSTPVLQRLRTFQASCPFSGARESVNFRRRAKHFVATWFYCRLLLTPRSTPMLEGHPLAGCQRLRIRYILSYHPCLEAVSSIRKLTRHAVVTRGPLNMGFCIWRWSK
jgi:hypothetical protein